MSDFIFWHSRYDLTKPLQLMSDGLSIATIRKVNCHQCLDMNKPHMHRILNLSQFPNDKKLLHYCLLYATIQFSGEKPPQKERYGRYFKIIAVIVPAIGIACHLFPEIIAGKTS